MHAHWPAVNHHGPSVGHGLGLDSSNKSQQACGVIGHAVVRPAREVKLPYLPDLMSPSLRSRVIVLNTHSRAQRGGGETTENTERLRCERALKQTRSWIEHKHELYGFRIRGSCISIIWNVHGWCSLGVLSHISIGLYLYIFIFIRN